MINVRNMGNDRLFIGNRKCGMTGVEAVRH